MKFKKSKKYFFAGIVVKAIYLTIALIGFITVFINKENVNERTIGAIGGTNVSIMVLEILGLFILIRKYKKKKAPSILSIVLSFIIGNIPSGVLFIIAKSKYDTTKEKNETS